MVEDVYIYVSEGPADGWPRRVFPNADILRRAVRTVRSGCKVFIGLTETS